MENEFEHMTPEEQIVEELFQAAEKENWSRVDNDLVPRLKSFNGDKITELALGRVGDENPNIRDVVATSIAGVEIKDPELLDKAFEAMKRMATNDQEMFPTGRAMVALWKWKDAKPGMEEIQISFRKRVEENDWQKELLENIPSLEEILR